MKLIPRVLFMDDERLYRKDVSEILKREGIDVETARSMKEFADLVGQDHFDAGIIDIRMSKEGKEGLDAISLIRKSHPEMYLEVITAYEEFTAQALQRGADSIFIKPNGVKGIAQRIKDGILKKKVSILESASGVNLQEIIDQYGDGNNGQSAWVIINATILTDCVIGVKSFLGSEVDNYNLDKDEVDVLQRDLVDFVIRRVMKGVSIPKGQRVTTASELSYDENFREYLTQKETLRKKYLGHYVSFVDGKFAEADADIDALHRRLDENHPRKAAFIKKLTEREKVVNLSIPRRVKRG